MNGSVSYETLSPKRVTLAAALFVLFFTFTPTHAFAQVASVQTQQILPPGQSTCQTVQVLSVQPYVYDGTLQSFDVTISDPSYVGVLGTVAGNPVPLQYITRWAGTPGGLKIHVDTPATPITGAVPVMLTMLSSLPNQHTCITSVTFTVRGVGISTIPSGNNSGSSSTSTGSQNTDTTSGSVPSHPIGHNGQGTSGSTAGKPGSTHATGTNSNLLAIGSPIAGLGKLSGICKGTNAYRLWVVLLLVYIIIAAVVVFVDPWFLEESVVAVTSFILVPLLLLLGFWYFSLPCRAAPWIPVVACIIAIVALFLAFREEETMIMLPEKISS